MNFTVAITGMNARADNPGPGYAVARCLQESPDFLGRVVGLGYDVLDAGLYHPHCQASYLLPYPSAGDSALLERLLCIHEQEALDAVIPCLDSELPAFLAIAPELERRHTADGVDADFEALATQLIANLARTKSG